MDFFEEADSFLASPSPHWCFSSRNKGGPLYDPYGVMHAPINGRKGIGLAVVISARNKWTSLGP